jgi:hypothetical protein
VGKLGSVQGLGVFLRGAAMKRQPIFSVVTEASTREVTGIFSLEKSIRSYLKELKRSFPNGRFEVIVSADYPPAFALPSKNVRWVSTPGVGYFGLKNAGFKAARGRYVAFWDSDCRPASGYGLRAVRRLESDPKLSGVAGASFYMGHSYFGRLEGVFSYGHLHLSEGPMTHAAPLAHNLVLRKAKFPGAPFGGFTERVGGDEFVSRYACWLGSPLWLDTKLNMYHERQDVLTQPAKGIEKRMLELSYPMLHRYMKSIWWVVPFAIRAALVGAYKRTKKLFVYRKSMSFSWFETAMGLPAILIILGVDGLLIAAMALWPPFLKKTLRYQCGDNWNEVYRYMDQVTPKQYRVQFGSLFTRDGWASRKRA